MEILNIPITESDRNYIQTQFKISFKIIDNALSWYFILFEIRDILPWDHYS